MNISGIGRAFDQARIMQFEKKWQQKKMDFIQVKPAQNGYEKDNYISAFMKQNSEAQKANTLQFITNKLKSGKRLSHAEMEYLKINAPALYEKALKIEKEREEYRNALRNCKTKEEARRVQASKNMQLQAEADPAPGKEKNNDEDIEFIGMRIMAMLDESAEFAKSKEYMDLPNEEEKGEKPLHHKAYLRRFVNN